MTPAATTEPAELTDARESLALTRQTLARSKETIRQNREALRDAEAEHVRESTNAALEGLAPPKIAVSFKNLRESVETAEAVLADLEAREIDAKGRVRTACYQWGEALVREQYAADVKAGRAALLQTASAVLELTDALGDSGLFLLEELIAHIPIELRNRRVARLSALNGIFGEHGDRNPAFEIGQSLLIEAGCPTIEEVRQLAAPHLYP